MNAVASLIPEPSQDDRERAVAVITQTAKVVQPVGYQTALKHGKIYAELVTKLAAEFAAVRSEATKMERERCAKVCEQVGDGERRAFNGEVYLTDADKRAAEFVQGADVCAAAIRKGEP